MLLTFKKAKGCAFVAAFFTLVACQDSNLEEKSQHENTKGSLQSATEALKSKSTAESTNNIVAAKQADQSSENDNNKNLEPIADVFLSLNPKDPAQKSFSCDDQIYLTIKFANHQPKLHQINISWKDPSGEERENNSFPFFVTQKESTAWASLKLHRSVGAGMLQWVNPAAGLEEFIGQWTADVKVGSILNETHNFEVLC